MKTNLTTRRDFLKVTGLGAAGALLPFQCQKEMAVKKADFYYVYVGTYTSGGSKGIYVYKMDMSPVTLDMLQGLDGIKVYGVSDEGLGVFLWYLALNQRYNWIENDVWQEE